MLISYHMYSFRARRKGLLEVDLIPPVVMELDNLRGRIGKFGDDFKAEEAYDQAEMFQDIINNGREEISRQREMAQDADDVTPYLTRAQELMKEMSAAKYLLELMTNG
jgi:hypothetical protein